MRPRTPKGLALVSMMALLAAFAAAPSAQASSALAIFTIQIDSKAAGLASGPGGLLDFQLNPSTVPSSANVKATVNDLQTDLTLGSPTATGGASGQLQPGTSDTVTLNNGTSYNDLNQSADLPTNSYLDVTVSITVTDPTATGASGTAFYLSLYDGNRSDNPATATLTVQPDGTVTSSASSPTNAGVTITLVPEPSTLAMLGLGIGAIAVAGRRERGGIRIRRVGTAHR